MPALYDLTVLPHAVLHALHVHDLAVVPASASALSLPLHYFECREVSLH